MNYPVIAWFAVLILFCTICAVCDAVTHDYGWTAYWAVLVVINIVLFGKWARKQPNERGK